MMPPASKILIVDDLSSNIETLSVLFQEEHEIFFSTQGADAVVLADAHLPDLVLLDIMMPDMDGWEVATQLKANPRTRNIPIIFVTAMTSDLDEAVGLKLGAVDYVTKPINATVVKLRVNNQLELKRYREQLESLVEQRTSELLQARDEAHEREQLLWTLLESSLDAFIMTNYEGKIIDFNPAAERLFGYARRDVMGRDVSNLIIPPKMRAQHRHAMRLATEQNGLGGKTVKRRMIGQGIHANGDIIDLEIALSTVVTHGRPVYTSFLRDITYTRQLLRALSATLHVAESTYRAKDLFLANMSHEIRTPVNGVLGMIDLTMGVSNLPPRARGFLVHAKTSSNLLLRVIDDILDFSRIGAGKMVLASEPFYLGDLLADTVTLFKSHVLDKDIEMIVAAPPKSLGMLEGDPMRLQQVLANLTGNAVKFTQAGEVHLKVTLVEQTDTVVRLEFSIRDTGIGLSEEQRAILFAPFVQADSSITRRFGGTGLGLAICKHLVEAMQGKIWVESLPGEGSTFSFTVVMGRSRQVRPYTPVVPEDMRDLKVLVVDDNEHARMVVVEVLRHFGLEVRMAGSGADALRALQTADEAGEPYALVLLDWRMPEMDGIETAEKILAGAATTSSADASADVSTDRSCVLSQVPKIIFMSAFGHEELIQAVKRIGVDACLFKPVTPSLLLDTLLDVFGKSVCETHAAKAEEMDKDALIRLWAGVQVLLVEDNAINQKVLQEMLAGVGIFVTLANHGQEALDAVQAKAFDLVFMDVQMPVMDGYKATRKMREMDRLKGLPIVAMTAHAMAGDRENCLASGMSDYVSKPVDAHQVFAVLLKWLKPHERQEQDDTPLAGATSGAAGDLLPEDVPGIDVAEGLQRLFGNRNLLKALILRFGADHGDADRRARAILAVGDPEGAAQVVHAVGEAARLIAAVRLHGLSVAVGQKLRQGGASEESLASILASFCQELQIVVAASRLVEKNSASRVVSGAQGEARGRNH